jgi:fatty acid desaturase
MRLALGRFISLEGYRQIHLAHHRHYFTDDDPDYCRKHGSEWTFPKRATELITILLGDLLGRKVWQVNRGKQAAPPSGLRRRQGSRGRVAYYAAFAGALTVLGVWPCFLLYWILPLLTVLQVIVRWGALCEHT